jgi:hypothetical protein
MPVIIPPAYALVSHFHTIGGLARQAVVTYGITAPAYNTALATDLHGAWADGPVTDMSDTINLVKTTVKQGPVESGPTYEFAELIGGGGPNACSPPNVCWLVKKVTASGGRANRGRMYLPGVYESAVDNTGQLTGSEPADMQAQIDEWFAALAAIDVTPVILHSGSSDPTPVITVTVEAVVATQRRRLVRT